MCISKVFQAISAARGNAFSTSTFRSQHRSGNRCAKQQLVVVMLVGLLFGVSACTTQTTSVPMLDTLPKVSAVAVTQPGFAVSAGSKIAWRTELLWLGEGGGAEASSLITSLPFQSEIEQQLSGIGLTFGPLDKADYTLVAAVVLGDNPDGVGFRELTRLYPGLGPVSLTLERESLMLAVSHPGSPVIQWRGTIKLFFDNKMTPQQKQLHLQAAVRSILNTLPTKMDGESTP